MGIFEMSLDDYTIECKASGLPGAYDRYCANAVLVEEFEITPGSTANYFVAVRRAPIGWPFLVVAQGYTSYGYGYDRRCGALLIPETNMLFVGVDERLLAYELTSPRRLWQDQADTEFWHWRRHGGIVLMAAELEMAAWDIHGRKRWTTFVEPPWDYTLDGDLVQLRVLDVPVSFPIATGPRWGATLPWR